ncbi:molybdenum cofactor biosynthesis protein B [Methanomethylovorans sp. PtaU1.Bin093]|jgi:molybdenum cofactor biosynthesis protein B|uniref:MogA/MoaB family molybdenum cofactor biosynthesis protein n=1 Tax=Methanomethylovorans sp. PtaU1.Bin093 TaxID=1811679 RepID=UPI0025D23848|nr:MogA/MoaB family molybdenum cofactor biosynthesis protein [Methanomethylovorans sp. PtaU1.Bin093]
MQSSTPLSHKQHIKGNLRFALITVSTSRFNKYGSAISPQESEDLSGDRMYNMVQENGHEVVSYSLVPDDPACIRDLISRLIDEDVDVIVTSGGTGLSPDDVTIEAISPLFHKEIQGFGEYFRYLSIGQIGSSVVLTRACAGIADNKVIFCIPGSPNAVDLAFSEVILPEAGHILKHLGKVA